MNDFYIIQSIYYELLYFKKWTNYLSVMITNLNWLIVDQI